MITPVEWVCLGVDRLVNGVVRVRFVTIDGRRGHVIVPADVYAVENADVAVALAAAELTVPSFSYT
jgi:hypothetical protein